MSGKTKGGAPGYSITNAACDFGQTGLGAGGGGGSGYGDGGGWGGGGGGPFGLGFDLSWYFQAFGGGPYPYACDFWGCYIPVCNDGLLASILPCVGNLSPPGGSRGTSQPGDKVGRVFSRNMSCGSSADQVMDTVESDFPAFGNYSRLGGLESVTFSPTGTIGVGSTIPIEVNTFGIGHELSVNVDSMTSGHMTFTTNPGHLLYPAYITFSAGSALPGSIDFYISLEGTIANSFEFRAGGEAFEDAQWNHFLDKVQALCGVGQQ